MSLVSDVHVHNTESDGTTRLATIEHCSSGALMITFQRDKQTLSRAHHHLSIEQAIQFPLPANSK